MFGFIRVYSLFGWSSLILYVVVNEHSCIEPSSGLYASFTHFGCSRRGVEWFRSGVFNSIPLWRASP